MTIKHENRSRQVEVTRTYVEMTEPSDLVASSVADQGVRVDQVFDCPASFHRYLYAEVGRHYHWVDRLPWTDSEIRSYLGTPGLSLWLMRYRGAPAGYFELQRHEDGSVEIAYFGLIQEYLGRGFGKYLLTCAVEQAWSDGANRVWLHTCTLDDPAALPNYLKRGFRPFKEEKYVASIDDSERLKVDRMKSG
jgi:GNAT superfamily N-acetyltransferase